MQIKTTMRSQFTRQNGLYQENKNSVDKDMKKREALYTLEGVEIGENSLEVPQKIRNTI